MVTVKMNSIGDAYQDGWIRQNIKSTDKVYWWNMIGIKIFSANSAVMETKQLAFIKIKLMLDITTVFKTSCRGNDNITII